MSADKFIQLERGQITYRNCSNSKRIELDNGIIIVIFVTNCCIAFHVARQPTSVLVTDWKNPNVSIVLWPLKREIDKLTFRYKMINIEFQCLLSVISDTYICICNTLCFYWIHIETHGENNKSMYRAYWVWFSIKRELMFPSYHNGIVTVKYAKKCETRTKIGIERKKATES